MDHFQRELGYHTQGVSHTVKIYKVDKSPIFKLSISSFILDFKHNYLCIANAYRSIHSNFIFVCFLRDITLHVVFI